MAMSERCYGLIVDGNDTKVPLKESKVQVTLQGFIANVESQLTYTNDGPDPLQTSFVFPMDDMSAVYKFEADVNKKHIIAECQDKDKAKETYKEAITQGHTAMLLSEDDTAGDIFECKLGNLPAGETALLKMTYVVELSVEPDGKMRFTLPTVLNPRYCPVGSELPAGQKRSSSEININTPCKLTFTAAICGQYKIQSVTSANDKLNVTINDDGSSATVDLSEDFKFDHDLSFDVIYDDLDKPEVILEPGDPTKDGLLKEDVLMLNFYPDIKRGGETEDHKREFIFVIDRSGSMGGEKIEKAKETLLLLLKSLPVGCLFNVVSFGSNYSSLFDKSQEYTKETLKTAIDLQKTMDSNMGGTEILQPLKSIYSHSCKQGYPRQIFLMTDGEVSNTNEVIELVRKHKGNTRVFTFGIGRGASSSLIKNVAKASNGKTTFIKEKDNMQSKVISAMKVSLQNCLQEVQLEWNLPSCCSVIDIPKEPPVVFNGEKLVLFALIKSSDSQKGISGSFILKGNIEGQSLSYNVTIETPRTPHPDLPLHRIAAKYQIKELELDDNDGDYVGEGLNKEKIILVSQAANIMSKYTAFVGVDKDTKVPISVKEESMAYDYQCSYRGDSLLACGLDNSLQLCGLDDSLQACGLDGGFYKSKKKSRSFGFSMFPKFSLPSLFSKKTGSKSRKSKMAMADNPDRCMPTSLYCNVEKPTNIPGSNDKMIEIISLQNFDGSWNPSDELSKMLKVTEEELKLKYQDNVWCTAVVLVFLKLNFISCQTEWEMIYNKAIKWMTSQDRDGKSVREILKEVEDESIVKVL